jgi:hypothetical protein
MAAHALEKTVRAHSKLLRIHHGELVAMGRAASMKRAAGALAAAYAAPAMAAPAHGRKRKGAAKVRRKLSHVTGRKRSKVTGKFLKG